MYFLTEVQLTYNIVLISNVQQNDLVVCTYPYFLFLMWPNLKAFSSVPPLGGFP